MFCQIVCTFWRKVYNLAKGYNDLRFGKYVETLRKSKEKSLREKAKAIKVSPQFYREVEKGRSSTFTSERLKSLAHFLMLDDEETHGKERVNLGFG